MGKRAKRRGWIRYAVGAFIATLSGSVATAPDVSPFAPAPSSENTGSLPKMHSSAVPSGSGGATPTGPKPSPTVSLKKKAAPVVVRHAAPQPTKTPVAKRVSQKTLMSETGNPPKPATPVRGVSGMTAFLLAQVGKEYVYGGTGPSAYDCSGLVQAAFLHVGIVVPRTSQEQSLMGTRVPLNHLMPGDVLFWGEPGTATHSAVYIGHGLYVAAENSRVGVVEYSLAFFSPDFARRL